jgi:sugar lactone lactonase YvrE
VYVTYNTITRVDPDTGEKTTIFDPGFSTRYGTAHAVNFNLDSTKMYIATIGPGTVFEMDLDANLDPTSDPTAFYTGLGAWMDGIELDECGNLYIADYSDSALWRITADGSTADMMTTPSSTDYGHGVTWGNGVGDWAADTLYLPQPYAGYHVREVRIGFASGDTVRTWNGVPASY